MQKGHYQQTTIDEIICYLRKVMSEKQLKVTIKQLQENSVKGGSENQKIDKNYSKELINLGNNAKETAEREQKKLQKVLQKLCKLCGDQREKLEKFMILPSNGTLADKCLQLTQFINQLLCKNYKELNEEGGVQNQLINLPDYFDTARKFKQAKNKESSQISNITSLVNTFEGRNRKQKEIREKVEEQITAEFIREVKGFRLLNCHEFQRKFIDIKNNNGTVPQMLMVQLIQCLSNVIQVPLKFNLFSYTAFLVNKQKECIELEERLSRIEKQYETTIKHKQEQYQDLIKAIKNVNNEMSSDQTNIYEQVRELKAKIEELEDKLIENDIEPKVRQLIKQKYNKKEQKLHLNYCPNDWLAAIKHRDWQMLKKLQLWQCKITDENLTAVTSKQWPQLKQLCLYNNNITYLGIKQLVCMQWSQLLFLDLSYNNFGSVGAKQLSKINMPVLEKMELYHCRLGSEGVRHLTKGKWPKLIELRICRNGIGLNGYQAISEAEWQQLNELWMKNCNWQTGFYTQPISVLSLTPTKSKIIKIYIKRQNKKIKMEAMNALKKKGMELV